MKITAEPRSDQWNADDFVGGPRIFTVAGVKAGKAEQKYDIELAGEERCWRPPLTVLRLLIAAWGDDATQWVGRRVELYRDDSITFGRDQVGGIRISRMSDLPGGRQLRVALTATRGKRAGHVVEPLIEQPAPKIATAEEIAASSDRDELRSWWQAADEDTRALIQARVGELDAEVVES